MLNPEIVEYLDNLDLSNTVRTRIEEVAETFAFLCGSALEQLFVADIRTDSGERRIQSLWGFAGRNWMEARNFQRQSDVDISPYKGSIYYLGLQYENIIFPDIIGENAWMSVEIRTAKVDYSTLSAVGNNCSYLIDIVNNLFLPTFRDNAYSS